MDPFRYCPRCATPLEPRPHSGDTRPSCPREGCGFVAYDNPLPVVAAVLEIPRGLVLARPANFPPKMFGLVAGFLERGEDPRDGVLREVQEEVGLTGTVQSLLGVYPFPFRNELIIAFHVTAEGDPIVGEELAEVKVIPLEKVRSWPMGTGLALSDFLRSRGVPG